MAEMTNVDLLRAMSRASVAKDQASDDQFDAASGVWLQARSAVLDRMVPVSEREHRLKKRIDHLGRGLALLDDMIWNDTQIIERAGQMRAIIRASLNGEEFGHDATLSEQP